MGSPASLASGRSSSSAASARPRLPRPRLAAVAGAAAEGGALRIAPSMRAKEVREERASVRPVHVHASPTQGVHVHAHRQLGRAECAEHCSAGQAPCVHAWL